MAALTRMPDQPVLAAYVMVPPVGIAARAVAGEDLSSSTREQPALEPMLGPGHLRGPQLNGRPLGQGSVVRDQLPTAHA